MADKVLTDDELRRIELAATANVASRSTKPGPLRSSSIPEPVRADIGRYLVLEAAETMLRLIEEVRALRPLSQELAKCHAAMIRAMDALESDAKLDARREAFELIQERFEGVSSEDHDTAAGLVESLRAELHANGRPS